MPQNKRRNEVVAELVQTNLGHVTSQTVASDETIIIPLDYSMMVAEPFEVNGDVEVNGTLKIL